MEPKRLWCWSGGGLPALDIHCGIWSGLEEFGLSAAAHAGTSAGAVAAAFCAVGWSAGRARELIESLNDRDVRQERPLWQARLPWIDSFLVHDPIEGLLNNCLPERFEELGARLTVHATDEQTGEATEFSQGPLVRPLLASLSIPGVWPAVQIGSNFYSDGATTANLPLPMGWTGYDDVFLLVARRPLRTPKRFRGVLGRLLYALDILAEDQVRDTIHWAAQSARVRVIRPAVAPTFGALRFDHGLIEEAKRRTIEILRNWRAEGAI